ncbi:hypothetical protein IV102_11640 [bacterium]|nr:hypothetical protein [bacterium]
MNQQSIHDFEILVRHGALQGSFSIDDFLGAYRDIQPSLHRYCNVEDMVDIDDLLYVLARLPEGIHMVREILVQSDIPDKVPELKGLQEVFVASRRRATFLLGPERMVIVAREGVTELLDLVTLLSAFEVESRKLERLLKDTELMTDLRAFSGPDQGLENRLLVRLAFEIGTTDDQIMALREVWGDETLARVVDLVDRPSHLRVRLHRDYCLQSALDRSRTWARRLAQEVARRTSGQRKIHLMSSNTHSTVNLLSPFVRKYAEEILAFEEVPAEVAAGNRIYYLLKRWMEAHPEKQAEQAEMHAQVGIYTLSDLDRVGVTAQLIDLARLPAGQCDPRLGQFDCEAVIVNFDYAFGDQAGVVGEQLFRELGGHHVCSLSIMGKAGCLVGARGSLMLPSYLIREGTNDLYDIPGGNWLEVSDLEGLVGEVHGGGPVLTVLGTILQNDDLLRSYRDDWKVLGLEMEGIPYLRAVHQALKLGLLREGMRVAIGYYASDTPLVPGESLARSLSTRGLDATYGLNIALLRKIIEA